MTQSNADVPILIPAYEPGEPFVLLVRALLQTSAADIILVDDGSLLEFEQCLQRIGVSARLHVVHHAVNLGKGAALKTGMNYALVHFPDCRGVVSADADGQHHWEDILRVADRLRDQPGCPRRGGPRI